MTMILRTFTRQLLRRTGPVVADFKRTVDQTVCIDLECTCDSPVQISPMEVIEIACYKYDLTNIDLSKNKVVRKKSNISHDNIFHRYVKPIANPELTVFCQDLTGIIQSDVDNAQTIDVVLKELFNWLKKESLIDDQMNQKQNFAFASCGNFDLKLLSPITRTCMFDDKLELLPIYFKEWINVKKLFVNHKREWPNGLHHMMELLGEESEGRLHSAKDDCLNLAKVVDCLHHDGCIFHITNRL